MPRKKRSKTGGFSGGVALVVVVLFLFGVAAILLLSFFQSPRGSVILLDIGFTDRYETVQDTIDAALGAALRELGLDKNIQEKTSSLSVGTRVFHRRDWSVGISKPESLTRVNVALTAAVERAGGVVRSSVETSPGALTFEAGSRKHATHLIRISDSFPGAGDARTGAARTPGDEVAGEPHRRGEAMKPADKEGTGGGWPPRIALVIDDFGYSKDAIAEEFFCLDLPLTVSVIPALPYTKYAIERAAMEGKEVILHLPMEAEAFASDVPAVLTTMTGEEIASLVASFLAKTPGVAGVNNHLGSVATQDARVMKAVLEVLKPRGLYFLDSLTSNKSVAYNSAKSLGVPAARNDLFVDADTEDPEIVRERLDRLLDIARARGYAVGIGHPKPWTWTAVQAFKDRAKESGVEFVFLSDLVE